MIRSIALLFMVAFLGCGAVEEPAAEVLEPRSEATQGLTLNCRGTFQIADNSCPTASKLNAAAAMYCQQNVWYNAYLSGESYWWVRNCRAGIKFNCCYYK